MLATCPRPIYLGLAVPAYKKQLDYTGIYFICRPMYAGPGMPAHAGHHMPVNLMPVNLMPVNLMSVNLT